MFAILIIVALVFAVCFFLDRAFTKAFRSKAQHFSGRSVRANRRYGIFAIVLSMLGIIAIGMQDGRALLLGGIFVLLIGLGLAAYYLGFGIFYDGETFLVSSFGKKSVSHRYDEILGQRLYLIQGGNIVVELHLKNQQFVSVQSSMEGIYPFLDTAFAGWCLQTGRDPQSCSFHDPAKSLWFPTVEEQ